MWGGERKSVNIRIDEKLYRVTKPILQRYFGSVCAAIEPYLASIYSIATNTQLDSEHGVIPSITVDIGHMNIRRHMKARRKFVIEEETEVLEYQHTCTIDSCKKPATYECQVKGDVVFYCDVHFNLKDSAGMLESSKPILRSHSP